MSVVSGQATDVPVVVQKQKKPFYRNLWGQVVIALLVAIVLGYVAPERAVAMRPLGDAFIRLISMVITLVIFCTVVTGIAGMGNLRKVGRVGGKALLYFEIVTTIALAFGLLVGNVVKTGTGFNADASKLDAAAVAAYAGQAKGQTITDFLLQIIPTTVIDAFARGSILGVVLVSLLFGFALSTAGKRCQPLVDVIESLTQAVFGVVNILMRFAPIGAFGAMAFTIGKYGVATLVSLASFMMAFYVTCLLFVFVVLGAVAALSGFSIFKFIRYIKEELLIVLGTSSSESVLPRMIAKMENLGCEKSVVGLVIPTGYSFNLDGTCIYLTMAAIFLAQATGTELTIWQELGIIGVLPLTSKGAAGVTGSGFIVLAATLASVGTIPVASIALILGIDRFMSEARALTNLIGNGVATVVVAKWEGALDEKVLHQRLNQERDVEADDPESVKIADDEIEAGAPRPVVA